MADKTNCTDLATLRKCIRVATISARGLHAGEFEVIALHRYLTDPQHVSQTGSEFTQGGVDVIQVTLSDGHHKLKVLLAPVLNKLVQKKELQTGSVIVITQCKLHYDETDLAGSSIIIIQELKVTGWKSLSVDTVQSLTWSPECLSTEKDDRPLTSSRAYYVNVWSTVEMWGDLWKTTAQVEGGLGDVKVEDLYTIKEVAKKWLSIKNANPVLLVRVLLKSRMIHYAKPGKSDKWPFQSHMLVADRSGACTAVFWNAMCPEFYSKVTEGDVLLLKKFTVKKSYQVSPRFRPALGNMELFDVDLNINSHHPTSEVRHIDPAVVVQQLELPDLQTNFVTRRQIGALPDNFICDIVGMVVYIGRLEREPMQNKFGYDSGGFWVRRWLHLQDGTSKKPICLQLYRIAQRLGDTEVKPGQVLVCRHVRVVQKLEQMSSSRSPRHVYLTTTAESQVSLLRDGQQSVFSDEPVVKTLFQWCKSSQCKTIVRQSVVGGYHQYPPLPTTLTAVRDAFKDTPVVASVEWERLLTGLCYKESHQILIQAVMVHVQLKNLNSDAASNGEASPSKKRRTAVSEVVLDQQLYQSEGTVTSLGSGGAGEATLPVCYSHDSWTGIKTTLEFPDAVVSSTTGQNAENHDGELDFRKSPYFSITWMGLNSRIMLQTLFFCHSDVTFDTSFTDMLSGTGSSHNPLPLNQLVRLPDVLNSAHQCADKRFLVVLDCYQTEELELVVNRALPLSSVT